MTKTSSLLLSLCMALALLASSIPPARPEFTTITPESSAPAGAPPAESPARTDPDEQAAVYEIMEATGNGWAASVPDVCREGWHGIECAPDEGGARHVVSLSFGALSDDAGFPACGRSSSLSPALARLSHLRSLFFYRCFSGDPHPIPPFLGSLSPSLRTLVLRENGHVGAVPAELGNLASLRVLDLHGNSLSSSIPPSLSALTRLQLLDLSQNTLTGVIPILRLPSLRVLDLSNNELEGQIPPFLDDYCPLIKLDLSRNRLGGRLPESIGRLRDLILLDLSRNRLSGPLPGSVRSLASLRSLILSGNYMGGAIPGGTFAGMRSLTTLALSGMGLEGPIPEPIGQIVGLRVLHLDGNRLNGSIPWSFRNLTELSELRLDNNQLMGPLPFAREVLWRLGRKLGVSNNSGLCYDGMDGAAHLPGVGPCEARTTRTATAPAAVAVRSTAMAASAGGGQGGRLVRHPAASRSQSHASYSGSPAFAREWSTLVHLLLLAAGVVL